MVVKKFWRKGLNAKTISLPEQQVFSKFVHNKAIQKARESMYTYDILMIFIQKDSKIYLYNLFENEVLKAKYMELMDDAMADMIIKKDPWYFEKLPESFRTETRLLSAISLLEPKHYRNSVISEEETKLLTAKVCRAFVKKGSGYPKFPQKTWTQDFVDYCMKHSPNDDWFEQMPAHFQTIEIAEKMLECSLYNASRIKPELISEKWAKQLFRSNSGYSNNYRDYTPKHYLTAFKQLTGFPEDFFGGEVPFNGLKDIHSDFTYCRMGESYIGFYNNGSSWKPDYRLVVTRRNAMKFVPETVFEHYVGTFHQTWLEKLISDCDPNFEKPTVSKSLKEYQTNGYYELKSAGNINGADIYENRFLGGTVCFTTKIDGGIFCQNTKNEIIGLVNQFETAC